MFIALANDILFLLNLSHTGRCGNSAERTGDRQQALCDGLRVRGLLGTARGQVGLARSQGRAKIIPLMLEVREKHQQDQHAHVYAAYIHKEDNCEQGLLVLQAIPRGVCLYA
ncbi:MAG TPA: hypothetical protein VKD22_16205 [Ramlibacter sp.]|nr:hypothetical protein [Ramlibacter sp.]